MSNYCWRQVRMQVEFTRPTLQITTGQAVRLRQTSRWLGLRNQVDAAGPLKKAPAVPRNLARPGWLQIGLLSPVRVMSFVSINLEIAYAILSGNQAFGTRRAVGIAVEMILATRISLEEICRKQIGTFSSPDQEQASFSLAVPGPLVGGRASLLDAAQPGPSTPARESIRIRRTLSLVPSGALTTEANTSRTQQRWPNDS